MGSVAPANPDSEVVDENLYRIDDSKLANAYADPTVDWQSYDKIFVAELDVSNVKVKQPPRGAARRPPTAFTLTDEDRQLLQSLYAQKMYQRVFEEGGYTQATQTGPNTLLVRVGIIQIAPTAARDDSKSRGASRTVTYTQGSGSISIEGILQDGETGELLAIFSDTHEGSRFWGRNDRFHNRRDVARIFDYWARLFVKELDKVHGG